MVLSSMYAHRMALAVKKEWLLLPSEYFMLRASTELRRRKNGFSLSAEYISGYGIDMYSTKDFAIKNDRIAKKGGGEVDSTGFAKAAGCCPAAR